jgi:hypothetical protein
VKILRYVVFKGGMRENKVYIAIAVFTTIVIILAVFFSSNQLTKAYIEDEILGDSWSEDINNREGDEQLFGLEKWVSFTYRNNNDTYPAYVTVTSIKTLFMMNENDIRDETIETINKASEQGIEIDKNSEITGQRVTRIEGHKTGFFIYNGNDTSKESNEKIKIIGEYWNCEPSGTSIICIGIAWTTDNAHNNSEIVTTYWEKIIRDKEGTFGLEKYKMDDGLIFNVKCH